MEYADPVIGHCVRFLPDWNPMRLTYNRFDIDPRHRGLSDFEDYFIYNSEVCSNCFNTIRDIGPESRKFLDPTVDPGQFHEPSDTISLNEWYVRTDSTVGFHPDQKPTDRFGTTFCDGCGHANKFGSDPVALGELTERAKRIAGYTRDHTPIKIDPKKFARRMARLKQEPDNTGRETQILAVSFAKSVTEHANQKRSGKTEAIRGSA